MTHRPAVAFIASLVLAGPLAAQNLDSVRARRVDSVFAAYASTKSPGCALAVTQCGMIVYERGYGMASLEQQVPITPRTVFDLGSVSKQFTAASVLLLQLDGKLSLDDDVRRYLPELPALGGTVTLRQLITHTSGWRDYNDLLVLDGWSERDHTTDRDAWDTLKRQRALNFPPGSTYRYSNTGYFLLSEVVRRVSGMSLATFARSRIFQPLGMRQTRFLDDTRQVVPGRATAYTPADSGYVVEMSDWDQVGDGGVQSSVEDLARWDANFDSGVVGGPPLITLLTTHGRLNDGTEIAYTAGLVSLMYRGVLRLSHTGAWAGYRSAITRYPAQRLGILLTCNRADAGTGTLSNAVAQVFIPFAPLRTIATAAGPRHDGFYLSGADGTTLTLESRKDTLVLVSGTQRTPLSEIGEETFENASGSLHLRFEGTRLIATALGDVSDTLVRTEPVTTLPRERRADYVGTYVSPEVATTYQVVARDSGLYLRLSHGDDIPLSIAFADGFNSDALPTLRFLRGAGGRVTAMSFTGRGVHDLRLQRK
jgi:CubicO group peptidase (beta-lactamase class C family)